METPNYYPDTTFDQGLYTIEWSYIENTEADYENYLNDMENFFRQDSKNEVIEEEVY